MKIIFAVLLPLLIVVAAHSNDNNVTLQMNFYYGSTKVADITDTLIFSEDKRAYHLERQAKAVGLAKWLYGDVSNRSAGIVDDEHGLLMTTYFQQRGKRPPQYADRAMDSNQLQLRRQDEERQEMVTAPIFDYLSAVYRSYVLNRPTGGTLTVTNGWRLRDYVYTVGGEEEIETDMGTLSAVLLSGQSSRGERKIWLAPSLNYLPVRLYVNDKGHVFRLLIKAVDTAQ